MVTVKMPKKTSSSSSGGQLKQPSVKKDFAKSQAADTAEQSTETSASNPKKTSIHWSHSVHWAFKDGLLLSSMGLAAFLFLVLFSYDAQDPGFEMTGVVQTVHNYGGRTGAWLASFVLYILGVFAFILPFGLLIAAWVALRSQPEEQSAPRDYSRFVVSLWGLVLLVISGSGLATLFMPPESHLIHFPYSAGGVIGYELSQVLVSHLDLLATTLFLLVLFTMSISMLLNTSWLVIFEVTGQGIDYVWQQVKPTLEEKAGHWLSQLKQKVSLSQLPAHSNKPSEEANKGTEKKSDKKRVVIPNVEPPPVKKALSQKLNQMQAQSVPDVETEPQAESNTEAKTGLFGLFKKMTATESSKKSEKAEKVEKAAEPVEPEISELKREEGSSEAEVKVEERADKSQPIPVVNTGKLPDLSLLDEPMTYEEGFSEEQLRDLSFLLEKKLEEFGIKVTVESVQPGPVVTRFEILPAPGVKSSQINNLAKDLARVMSVKSVRVVDIIPGKAVIGIEIPNEEREMVSFREILASDQFQKAPSKLTIALGKDIAGHPVVADVAKMPHLLVAGTTGAGKSVGINSMILSLLYKATPDEVRLIMVDPKMLELSVYEDIPHLLTPVVTDMNDAANALRWCVFEMDRRYQLMAKLGVRNIAGFNAKVNEAIEAGEPIIDPLYQQMASFGMEQAEAPPTLTPLPYIVVVVDEFADMIMVVGKEVEQLIARIAQKARAAGIHLILATQRPSVNVITGLIKANIPTRISFMVNTKIDSRTILDQGGAEQLLGMGDMLYMPPGSGTPMRVHGAFVSDEEVHRVAAFVKSQGEPQYLETITKMNSAEAEGGSADGNAEQDPLYDEAVNFVIKTRKVSISLIQRQFKIGYNRSARMVEAMEAAGVISTAGNNGSREVLVPKSGEVS